MRVLIDIGHPAHVHFFKNLVFNLQHDGHDVRITTRDKEVSIALLEAYGLPYELRGEMYNGMFKKAIGMLKIDLKLYEIAKKFQPDLLMGVGNPYVAHIGTLLRKPAIIFTDTENVKTSSLLTYPFASSIITPEYFQERLDPKKQVKIRGFKEIAYLHPKYFVPDPKVLTDAGVSPDERLIILRFISWGASHDTHLKGITRDEVGAVIRDLSGYGRVLITSEKPIEGIPEKYRIHLPPEKMHSLLSFASLYIGEGGTMATEAAVLGTPSIHIESTSDGRASGELSGNFRELRDTYELMYFYATHQEALAKAHEILTDDQSKRKWALRRTRLFSDVIDVTSWLTDFVERYPKSRTVIVNERPVVP